MNIKKMVFGPALFGAGLGLGIMVSSFVWINDKPTIIVETKWKTITTVPTTQPDLSHTSLNPDEIKTILGLEAQPDNIYLNPSADPAAQVPPTTSAPPTTQTTSVPPTVARQTPPTTITITTRTLPPSTQPPSSSTSTPETQPPTSTTEAPTTSTQGSTTTSQ